MWAIYSGDSFSKSSILMYDESPDYLRGYRDGVVRAGGELGAIALEWRIGEVR